MAVEQTGMHIKTSGDSSDAVSAANAAAAALDRLGRHGTSADKALASMGNTFNLTSSRTKSMEKQMRVASMQTANLTAQFNDIGVMLAAGQSPLLLAMQQGTQINQVFAQMGGKASNVFPAIVAGIKSMISPLSLMTIGVIAGGAALVQWAMKADDSVTASERWEEALDKVEDALGKYQSAAKNAQLPTEKLTEMFGAGAEAAQAYYAVIAEIESRNTASGIKATLEEMQQGAEGIRDFFNLHANNKKTRVNIGGQVLLEEAAATANTLERQLETTEALYENSVRLADLSGVRTIEEDAYLSKLLTILTTLREMVETQRQLNNTGESWTSDLARQRLYAAQANVEAKNMLKTTQAQAHLSKLELQYGANSVQYRTASVQAERQLYRSQVNSLRVGGLMKQALMDSWDAANGVANVDIAGNIELATSATSGWAGMMAQVKFELASIASIIGQLGGGMITAAAKRTEIAALRAGQTVKEAALAAKRSTEDVRLDAQVMAVESRFGKVGEFIGAVIRKQHEYNRTLDDTLIAEREAALERERLEKKKAGGGGKAKKSKTTKEWERIRQEFLTEAEIQLEAYERQQEMLKTALNNKLITQEEYQKYMEQSNKKHQETMAGIDAYRYGTGLDQAGQFFGDMANAFAQGGDKMAKAARIFGAAEALVNAWRAYNQTLADPSLPFFAKFAAATAVLSAGLGAVQAIKSGSGSSAAGGASGAAASTASSASGGGEGPLRIMMDPIADDAKFSGKYIKELFTQLQKEAGTRGLEFV
jgi:hypothetical protein